MPCPDFDWPAWLHTLSIQGDKECHSFSAGRESCMSLNYLQSGIPLSWISPGALSLASHEKRSLSASFVLRACLMLKTLHPSRPSTRVVFLAQVYAAYFAQHKPGRVLQMRAMSGNGDRAYF